jgi:protein-S-isoprenylcysteine O-methyltransferase Ste14
MRYAPQGDISIPRRMLRFGRLFCVFPSPALAEEASPISVTPEPHGQSIGKQVVSSLKSLVVGTLGLGVLLFLPAGTLNYWQAWVLIAVFVPGSIATGIYLSVHDPELLERRKHVGPVAETRPAQKIAISVLILAFFRHVCPVGSGSPVRMVHSTGALSLVGSALAAIALYITFLVVKENSFGAANIKVFKDQKVIFTGPYALVRHPMYSGILLLALASPLSLGSWWGFLPVLLIIPMLICGPRFSEGMSNGAAVPLEELQEILCVG